MKPPPSLAQAKASVRLPKEHIGARRHNAAWQPAPAPVTEPTATCFGRADHHYLVCVVLGSMGAGTGGGLAVTAPPPVAKVGAGGSTRPVYQAWARAATSFVA